MIQVKSVSSDIRDPAHGANKDAAAVMPVNAAIMELVTNGCTIIGSPLLYHVDTSRFVYTITYDDPSLDAK